MRRATSPSDLWNGVFPAYLLGGCHLRWVQSVNLVGILVWGRPSIRDAQELVATLEAEPQVDRRMSGLADFRAAEEIAPATFQVMNEHVVRHADDYAATLAAQGVVRPPGYAGSVVSGFFEVTITSYPTRVFADAEEALAWLGHPDASDDLATLASIARAHQASPRLVASLRALLDQRPWATLSEAADQLQVAPRTLQHQLKQGGTTFRKEQSSARLRIALHRLKCTTMSVGAIGLDVGCATPQHFSDWFRSATGVSPREWRVRHGVSAPMTPE